MNFYPFFKNFRAFRAFGMLQPPNRQVVLKVSTENKMFIKYFSKKALCAGTAHNVSKISPDGKIRR